MDVRLDDVSVDVEDEVGSLRKQAGSPGKRKLSDGGRSVSGIPSSAAAARVRAPVASTRGRGRGRGKVRPGLHPPAQVAPPAAGSALRRPGLVKKASGSSTLAQRPQDGGQAARHVAGGVNKPRVAAGAPGSVATGARVAEFRRRFESADGTRQSPAAFSSPVAAMRPGYAAQPSSAAAKRTPAAAPAAASAGRLQNSRAPIRTAAAGQKSSAAAMREAARRAEASRINAAASSSSAVASARTQRTGNEPLFKTAARAESRLSRNSSDSSMRAQQADRRPRPAPLNVGGESVAPSAIPIPKTKAPSADKESLADSGTAGSADSGGWGLSSVISMLSPASWKQQAGVSKKPSASSLMETPTNAGKQRQAAAASPYDVNSPQTPYRPRPEHAGSRADLVMPSYKDVAVPLRRSSGRSSNQSERSVRGTARRPSHLGTVNQRLLD
ncbi:hypothetical protein GGI05_006889, partial [Coemansia sp. RSA 2603]